MKNEWIDVNKIMPDLDVDVLVFGQDGVEILAYSETVYKTLNGGGYGYGKSSKAFRRTEPCGEYVMPEQTLVNVTHWMPLPEPPNNL